jgi:TolA-binding protein
MGKKRAFLLLFLTLLPLPFMGFDLADVKKKYLEGLSFFTGGNLKGAESDFNDIINMKLPRGNLYDPYSARSYYFKGDIAFIKQDYGQAVDCYRTVASEYYNTDIYSRDLYKLGRTLILARRVSEGIGILEDYITRYKDADSLGDHGYYWLARGFAMNNDYFRAVSTYRFILTNYPSSALTFEVRSSLSMLQDNIEKEGLQEAGPTNTRSLLNSSERLEMQRKILLDMSRLLLIKQKLIDIKAAKIEMLSRMREQEGME